MHATSLKIVITVVLISVYGCADTVGDVCAPNTTALCNCSATVVGVQSCNADVPLLVRPLKMLASLKEFGI